MGVKVRLCSELNQFVGGREWVEVEGETIGECLANLQRRYPGIRQRLFDENGELFKFYVIFINSNSWYPEKLDKRVREGDELSILLLYYGG